MTHEKPIPDSAAPAAGKKGSWPEAGKKRKINKTETGILCSENKLFQITLPIYKKNDPLGRNILILFILCGSLCFLCGTLFNK